MNDTHDGHLSPGSEDDDPSARHNENEVRAGSPKQGQTPGPFSKLKRWFKQGKDENAMLEWRDNRDTIARIIPREIMAEQLFFRTKATIHPGEALLLMERGKMAGPAITAGQVVSSGLRDRIKKSLGYGKDAVMMAVDTGNLTLRISAGLSKYQLIYNDPQLAEKMGVTRYDGEKHAEDLVEIEDYYKEIIMAGKDAVHSQENQKAKSRVNKFILERYGYDFADERSKTPLLSKDRESIVLDVKLLIKIRTHDIAEIFKLVGREKNGRLTVKALESLVDQELSVRVFAPRINQHTADELRSNPAIIGEMQNNAKDELGEWLSGYGIDLIRLSLNPAITDHERAAVVEKEIHALDKLAEVQQSHLKDEVQREYERALLRLNHEQVLLKAKKEGDEELKAIAKASLLTDKERELSVEEIESRIKQLRLDAKIREKEVAFLALKREKELEWDIQRQKRLLGQEMRSRTLREKTDNEIRVWEVKSKIYLEQKQAQIAEMEKRLQIEQRSQKHIENIVETGAKAGILNGNNLTESIRQATVRKALDQSDPVAASFARAEGERHSKEAFKEGMNQHPNIGFSGKDVKMFVTKSFEPHKILTSQGDGADRVVCPKCNAANPVDANICGYCKETITAKPEK